MARFAPKSPPLAPVASTDGLPRWFVILVLVCLVMAIAVPVPAMKYGIAAAMGLAFVTFYRDAPHRTLLVFILALPVFGLFPPGLIPIPAFNIETLFIAALVVAAIRAGQLSREASPANALTPPITYLSVLLLASAAFSAAFLDVRVSRAGVWRSFPPFEIFSTLKNSLIYFVLPLVSFHLLSTPARLRAATRVIACAVILISAEGTYRSLDAVARGYLLETHRASGLIAGQPNLFGGFLAMIIVAFLPLLLGGGAPKWDRILYTGAIVACGVTILFTLSRGSWLALLVAGAFIAVFRAGRIVPLLVLLALTSSWWLPAEVVDRVELTTQGEMSAPDQLLEDSAQVRVDQWETFPSMLGAAPIFGHGYMMFQQVWERYGPTHTPKSAHSAIINFGTEQGLLGLIAYAWIVATIGWHSWRVFRRSESPFLQNLGLGLLGSVVCLVILDTSGNRFNSGEVMAYPFVLAGAIMRVSAGLAPASSRRSPSRPGTRRAQSPPSESSIQRA